MPHAVSRRSRPRRRSGLGAGLLALGGRVRPHGLGGLLGAGRLALGTATAPAFQFFDVTGILAYTLAFAGAMLAIEALLLRPLEQRLTRWRP
jgi:hypothetical protein